MLPSLPPSLPPSDKIKEALIAKIAMQCSDLYADAYSSMQVGAVKQIWEKVRGMCLCVYMGRGMETVQCELKERHTERGLLCSVFPALRDLPPPCCLVGAEFV